MTERLPALIMIQGPEPGSYYPLPQNRVTSIGRSSRNDVRIVSPSVSRFHCEVALVNGRWVLSDLNSKKGTLLNGRPVSYDMPLKPGDVIRLSSVIFRFDLMDENLQLNTALLAIKEAEMDRKVRVARGEAAAGTLNDIRVRAKLSGDVVRTESASAEKTLRASAIFVAAVTATAVVAVCVSLAVANARHKNSRPGAARLLYEKALGSLQEGRRDEALTGLEGLLARYADTPVAANAAHAYEETLWSELQARLDEVAKSEAAGDYAAAYRAYDALAGRKLPAEAAALVRERRAETDALARAAFAEDERRATGLVREGKSDRAAALYSQLRERIGLRELADKAAAHLAELTTP